MNIKDSDELVSLVSALTGADPESTAFRTKLTQMCTQQGGVSLLVVAELYMKGSISRADCEKRIDAETRYLVHIKELYDLHEQVLTHFKHLIE